MPAQIYTVAEMLRVGERSVYRLIESKRLRAVRVGRLVRIPEGALEDFVAGDPDRIEASQAPLRAVVEP